MLLLEAVAEYDGIVQRQGKLQNSCHGIGDKGYFPKQEIRPYIDYHCRQKGQDILACAYDSIGREEMRRFFYSDFINVVSTVIDRAESACGVEAGEGFKHFLAEFYTEALAGNLICMFRKELPYDRETIVNNLILILKTSIPNALTAKAGERSKSPNPCASIIQ